MGLARHTRAAAGAAALVLTVAGAAAAQQAPAPDRYGVALLAGQSYAPTGQVAFALLSGFALLDYGKVWHHPAPASLKFKVEGSAGLASVPEARPVVSAGVLALRYLDRLSGPRLTPYVEAGIGAIYTDFRIEGQGLRFNFNPQLGAGAEVRLGPQASGFFAMRGHHVSNGHLNHDNRGINSVVLMVGVFL
ncbi:MAG: acyloxyacyl hydrolase [Deltaproteobacteria bacterium]|nr:acyloxyacyl hydrolase [Deltaproteobacteria bacterium]